MLIFPSGKSEIIIEKRNADSVMLAKTHDDTWNVFNMQRITLNRKNVIIQTLTAVAHKDVKGHNIMLTGAHQRRTKATRTPVFWEPPAQWLPILSIHIGSFPFITVLFEDIGQGQRSLRSTHPLMKVIICA